MEHMGNDVSSASVVAWRSVFQQIQKKQHRKAWRSLQVLRTRWQQVKSQEMQS